MTKLRGVDVDIETSLKEYGIAWVEKKTEVTFYYGIKYDGEEYTRFDWASFDKDTDLAKEYDWVDRKAVGEYIGITLSNTITDEDDNFVENRSNLSLIEEIVAHFNYYGFENVFGTSYTEGLTYDEVITHNR